MKKVILRIFFTLLLVGFGSQSFCEINVILKKSDKISSVLLKNEKYIISYNKKKKRPNYVLYNVTDEQILGKPSSFSFRFDKRLKKTEQLSPKALKGSEFDRGHNAPNASFRAKRKWVKDTYVMTNVAPQNKYMNRTTWRYIETKERFLAKRYKNISILTGSCGKSKVFKGIIIPKVFYKVIETPQGVLSFLVPNKRKLQTATGEKYIYSFTYMNFLSTVEEIEKFCKIKIKIIK